MLRQAASVTNMAQAVARDRYAAHELDGALEGPLPLPPIAERLHARAHERRHAEGEEGDIDQVRGQAVLAELRSVERGLIGMLTPRDG